MKLPANAGGTRDTGLIPGLGRSPGGGQLAPVFLPEESPGQRSLEGYSPRVTKSQTQLSDWAHTQALVCLKLTGWYIFEPPFLMRADLLIWIFKGAISFPAWAQADRWTFLWPTEQYIFLVSTSAEIGGLQGFCMVVSAVAPWLHMVSEPWPVPPRCRARRPQPGGPQWWALPCSPSSASALSARALCSLPWHSCDFGPVPLRVPVSVVGTEHSTCHWASQPISRPLSQMTFMMNRKDIQSLGSVIDQNKAPQSLEAPSHQDRRGGWVVSQATDSPSGPGAACPHCGEQAP